LTDLSSPLPKTNGQNSGRRPSTKEAGDKYGAFNGFKSKDDVFQIANLVAWPKAAPEIYLLAGKYINVESSAKKPQRLVAGENGIYTRWLNSMTLRSGSLTKIETEPPGKIIGPPVIVTPAFFKADWTMEMF